MTAHRRNERFSPSGLAPSAMAAMLLCLLAASPLRAAPAAQAAPAKAVPARHAAAAQAVFVTAAEGVSEYRLANGLQILLVPDDSKPTTLVNMTYRVGSRHESYGETGMAHLLEHLLFKGSPRHPQVWAEFNKRGLSANGSTSADRTNYFASFAANDENLRWYLEWQADAMVNSFIARRDLDSEMTVVRNEMERGENDPGRVLLSRTLSAMYQWHNYGKSTIGARTDVEGVDIGHLQAFYKRYYQPDNATLIVSGKFEPAKVLAWVQQSFGPLPRSVQPRPAQYTLDPVQDGERAVTLRRVGGVPLLYAGYHVMPAAHPDFAAVDLLTIILADTPSGRLHKQLTEKRLAADVFAFAQPLHDPGYVLLGAQLSAEQDRDAASAALLGTIEAIRREPITDEELTRARAKWLKDWDAGFASPQYVGNALSEAVANGDWRLFFALRDRVRSIELADVQRVAEQVLLPSNRTLAQYLPTAAPQRAPAPARVDVAAVLKDFKGKQQAAAVEVFDASPANIDARTERLSLKPGLKVALLPKTTRGQAVKAQLVLRYGDEQSLKGWGQAPSMLAALLDKGTPSLDRQQFQDRLDALQSEVGFSAGIGQVSVSISSRREHLPAVIALVAEALKQPALPPAVLEELRSQALSSLEDQRKEPEVLLGNAMARHGNPYPRGDVRHARTFDEMEADWREVSIQKVRDFHRRFLGASDAQFAAVGDFEAPAVKAALSQAFDHWTSPSPYTRVGDPLILVPPARLVLPAADKQNASMAVSLSLPLNDSSPDYPAVMLANHLLGSGGNSRLWNRIREKDGLSYSVYSAVHWNAVEPNSEWSAEAIFAPQNREKVETAFAEEIRRALADGFTQAEFEAGKRGLLNYRRLSRAQDGVLTGGWVSNLYLDRSFAVSARVDAALESMTLQQVNEALRKYIRPDAFVTGVAGDFK